jgi:hypothetical protein
MHVLNEKLYVTIGGKKVLFTGTRDDRDRMIHGRRQFAGKKLAAFMRALRAAKAAKIDATNHYLKLLSSEMCIGGMIKLIEDAPPEIFWPVFCRWWASCDRTWDWNPRIVAALRRVGPCAHAISREYAHDDRDFFGTLPDNITVYRGATQSRIKGAFSWTADKQIARDFARGHRGIYVLPGSVVATAVISRGEVFWATDERHEREVICVPCHITEVETIR